MIQIKSEKENLKIIYLFIYLFFKTLIKDKTREKSIAKQIRISQIPSTKNKVPDNGAKNLLMNWQVHQFVRSSKVKTKVRVSNPQQLCLYLGRWIFY